MSSIMSLSPIAMVLMTVAGACAVFALIIAFLPKGNPVGSRMRDLAGSWEIGTDQRTVEKFITFEQKGKLQRQLSQAGWYSVTPAQLIVRCVLFGGGALAAGVGLFVALQLEGFVYMGLVALVTVGAAQLPLSRMNGAVKQRKKEVQRALPDLLDMLSSTVQAGLAFNAALAYAVPGVKGPLGDELRAVLSEIRVGRSRADALRAMAERIDQEELKTTVRAIVQSERLGSNLSKVLEDLGTESRHHRLLRGEEIAAKLPVLMVIPMAFFMLPALFTMIFGAVLADYFK
jgi:tight adherence protein C